jgi:hypothetical protein
VRFYSSIVDRLEVLVSLYSLLCIQYYYIELEHLNVINSHDPIFFSNCKKDELYPGGIWYWYW